MCVRTGRRTHGLAPNLPPPLRTGRAIRCLCCAGGRRCRPGGGGRGWALHPPWWGREGREGLGTAHPPAPHLQHRHAQLLRRQPRPRPEGIHSTRADLPMQLPARDTERGGGRRRRGGGARRGGGSGVVAACRGRLQCTPTLPALCGGAVRGRAGGLTAGFRAQANRCPLARLAIAAAGAAALAGARGRSGNKLGWAGARAARRRGRRTARSAHAGPCCRRAPSER